jgi:imidazolonepropionase-like amidohydrolase
MLASSFTAQLPARASLLLAALAVASVSACSSTVPPPAPPPPGPPTGVTVLRGARLIDGRGGPPIENATVVLDGQRVRAAGPADQVAVPTGGTFVDVAGKTLVPGLISDHSHVGMVDGVKAGADNYTRSNVIRQLAQFEAYGVTTITSLGLNSAIFYELQPDLHAGTMPGADLFGADRGVGVPAAAPPVEAGLPNLYRPGTPELARQAVREMAARHPTLVKIWVDDFHGTVPEKMSPAISAAVIDEAHQAGLRVAAHVYYLADAKELVAAGVDVLAHGVRDRAVDDELVQAMKAHHTWYIPTLGLDESFYMYAEQPALLKDPFLRHALQPALATQLDDANWRTKTLLDQNAINVDKQAVLTGMGNLKKLHDAGVSIGFGTDSGATPLRIPGYAEHRELKLMTDAGLTPLQAIRAATHDAAALLGLDDRGTLEPGKLADFVIVDGNPATHIEDLTRILAVWHRGRAVAAGVDKFTP